MGFFSRLFGSRNQRLINQYRSVVDRINALEPQMQALSDEALAGQTQKLRDALSQDAPLAKILPEAFATVREVGRRKLKMRHFDVQLIGGMALHQGKISEMLTGEGKTLVATLPAYLHALSGQTVHIVTVNDYLAKRDAEWMGPLYQFLGLTVGVNVPGMTPDQKRQAYACDILYGTNNEFGFDYLRDNMAFAKEDRAQRSLDFAIVDEVDSILIDEARTPLIISGSTEDSSELYLRMNALSPRLKRQAISNVEGEEEVGEGDYTVDEKTRQVYLTEAGHHHVEELLHKEGLLKEGESLYDPAHISSLHHINASLRAHAVYQVDVDYIVKDDQVIIVDEHTGRTMPGRRWGDGLHQAIEAKEGVTIHSENQTLASVTFQNYFRLYNTLSGMTGTADTEAPEFHQIYGLDVVVVPPNKPCVRQDKSDLIYLTLEEKYEAIVNDIQERRGQHQPILVGTASIENSERISRLLNEAKVPHQVLNAKFHEKEAQIIAEAGQPGAVTIATNMAGRGTDIVLGGNLEMEIAALKNPGEEVIEAIKKDWQRRHDMVIQAGGLYVLGTERHESRRIDNQLRGRSGRQGDPGMSRFYLSMQDNLMRIFAPERMTNVMQKLGMKKGEAIEHPWVSKAIANAQRKVEGHNFDIRKQLLEFDDVSNDQRHVIYSQRNDLLELDNISLHLADVRKEVINSAISQCIPPESMAEQWDVSALEHKLLSDFSLELPVAKWLEEEDSLHEEKLRERILEAAEKHYAEKITLAGQANMQRFEKAMLLRSLDIHWKEHLAAMDYLRQGIHLRGYAQKNPKQEYKREAYAMFTDMLHRVDYDITSLLMKVKIRSEDEIETIKQQRAEQAKLAAKMRYNHVEANLLDQGSSSSSEPRSTNSQRRPQGNVATKAETFIRQQPKVGRNDPCPCGSGKKYKQCHGKI